MQKLQDSVFSIVKTTNLSPAVFSFLQPSENSENVPLGGILNDTKHGWLALGPKFCVVDLRTGLKVAARTFGVPFGNTNSTITSVIELPTPLTENSKQLVICLECEDLTGLICILHINGSQILRCIQTDVVITEIAVCDAVPDGPLTSFDGIIMAGSKRGEIFAFDLNRASLIQALKDISQGYEHLVHTESNPANLVFLSFNALNQIEQHRDQALENDDHLALILNEDSLVDGQYLFRNPDGSVRMKAKRDHIRVSSLQYIPQLGSLAVGYNFGAFQIWNMMSLELEFSSQVNRECLPVTHFGFQEPCDDPRAFCYLWAVFSVMERFEGEEFPLAVMYSLTYQGKRMLSDTKCLYQEFLTSTIRFQVELGVMENAGQFVGGRCVSCHTYSVNSTLGEEGEDSMLNICQLVWECWGENVNSPAEYGMLLFDLDQWYKDQMPSTYGLQSNAFMSASWCGQLSSNSRTLDARLQPDSVAPYSHATRLEEHFYPNSVHYNCICLNTSDACVLNTIGIQRQIISSIDELGPTALLNPPRLYHACVAAGLTPLYMDAFARNPSQEEQRRFLLAVALEGRLARFLQRCARAWATGAHAAAGCTLPFLVDWCWRRALQLKENAKELTAPLFTSSSLPDRNVVRCLEHCVQQLTQLTGLLDAILTKCCNLIVPDALSEIEEKYKGVGTVSLYFQVVQWFLRVGLLPEKHQDLPYPQHQLNETYTKRRMKLQRLQGGAEDANKPCSLLYIDQLIEHEFGGERIQQMWLKGGSETNGLYPPPSLYSLLRLYLLPDIAEEHKHSLVLYLLVDYSMVYEVRYEAVVRRLMQFPTMFGLSNTAIKATQAFWHLDHRDFDFALDQLQCLTGNTLSEWQHHVVLSALLAQNMTQAALQYLHVRKPAPIQHLHNNNRVNDHDKLEDWRSCCNLYLARRLVHEALDVVRMCAQNATTLEDKLHVLNFFFKGCRNTGQLSNVLQVTLLPFEEEAFIRYLEKCNEPYTSDILIMYYLQQNRYLEAQQHNRKLRQNKRSKDISASAESILDVMDREGARDTLVDVVCSSLPTIATKVARTALSDDYEPHILAPKPLSVFVQSEAPKTKFTYKSSFIQDTIENASETWMNRPKTRRGIKRALNIEDTPFICTPKLTKTKSIYSDFESESTPPKRAKLDLTGTPRTPKFASAAQLGSNMSRQMAALLDMPEVHTPDGRVYDRSGAGTPHSILKIRNSGLGRDAPSPVDSRYLGDSDDELLETASNHTHYSDSTNKHLRFTIPTASESGSTPSPPMTTAADVRERAQQPAVRQKEMDDSMESFFTSTSTSHGMKDDNPLESPPKKLATEEKVLGRKSYKDNVRARRSLSISANSSLSEDPNTSIESIADIPVTLINPRYRQRETETRDTAVGDSYRETETRDTAVEDSYRETETRDTAVGDSYRETETRDTAVEDSYRETETRDTAVEDSYRETETRDTAVGDSYRETETRDTAVEDSYRETETRDTAVGDSYRETETRDTAVEDSYRETETRDTAVEDSYRETETRDRGDGEGEKDSISPPRTPMGRRGIRNMGVESTRLVNRSRSGTPERVDSPTVTPLRPNRITRSRSRTPEISPRASPLAPILEQPKQEGECEPHPVRTTLSAPSRLRSRSRTPERMEKVVESPRLAPISESPPPPPGVEPPRRRLRSRDRSPQLEIEPPQSPRTLRSRSKTPEKLMSPKADRAGKAKKTLTRIVLEANTFSKTKSSDKDPELSEKESDNENQKDKPELIECTPVKPSKQVNMDVSFSPIVNKSILATNTPDKEVQSADSSKADIAIPSFTKINETQFGKSVLQSCESSTIETSHEKEKDESIVKLPAFTMNESMFGKSVLQSYESSVAETSSIHEVSVTKEVSVTTTEVTEVKVTKMEISSLACKSVLKDQSSLITNDSDSEDSGDNVRDWKARADGTAQDIQKEKERIVEIEREIHEIEGDMSGTSDEEIVEAGDSEVDSEDGSTEEDNESSTESDDDIISILDTSDSNDIQLDEQTSSDSNRLEIQIPVEGQGDSQAGAPEIVNINKKIVTVVRESAVSEMSLDPLEQGQVSLLTDDNSGLSEQMELNYDDDDEAETQAVIKIDVVVEEVNPIEEENKEESAPSPKSVDVVDTSAVLKEPERIEPEPTASKKDPVPQESEIKKTSDTKEAINIESEPEKADKQPLKVTESGKSQKTDVEFKDTEDKPVEKEKPASRLRKRATSTSSNKSTSKKDTDTDKEKPETETPKKPTTRKRAKSTTSNQPEEADTPSKGRAKTPEIRKILTRRASRELENVGSPVTRASRELENVGSPVTRASRELEDVGSPVTRASRELENVGSPVTRASRELENVGSPVTRASRELENVGSPVTRASRDLENVGSPVTRASRELENVGSPVTRASRDLENVGSPVTRASRELENVGSPVTRASRELDNVESPTPQRRSTRTRSRNDDNVSVASEDSVKSTRSRASEKSERKGRKSIVAVKPELSAIPEVSADEAKDVSEYSNSRRLTRHQKAVLSSLELRPRSRRGSDSSDTAFDVQPIDRMSLLNKTDFEGSPDSSEPARSPESQLAQSSGRRTPRRARAASESKAIPKAAKIGRRVSVDVVAAESPVASPGRRASFTRACEALHTPKGRRTSTDLRKDTGSQPGSPAGSEASEPATPGRRGRRASTQSNTSAKGAGKRSKKLSTVEESDAKK